MKYVKLPVDNYLLGEEVRRLIGIVESLPWLSDYPTVNYQEVETFQKQCDAAYKKFASNEPQTRIELQFESLIFQTKRAMEDQYFDLG